MFRTPLSRRAKTWAWTLAMSPVVSLLPAATAHAAPVEPGTVTGVVVKSLAEEGQHAHDDHDDHDGHDHGTDTFIQSGIALHRVTDPGLEALRGGTEVELDVVDVSSGDWDVTSFRVVRKARTANALSPSAPTAQTVRIALVRPSDVAQDANPITTAQAQAALAAASNYWSSQTGGKITFAAVNTLDWYDSQYTCAQYDQLWTEAAGRLGYTGAAREHVVVVVPRTATGSGCSYGKGTIGYQGVQSAGALYVTDTSSSLWAHELGHNLGLNHASAAYAAPVQDAADATYVGYGNIWDVMSYSGNDDGRGSVNVAEHLQLGLLPGGIQTVTGNGTYTVKALPNADDGQIHGLVVTDPGTSTRYYVELRGNGAGDTFTAGTWRRPAPGVLITKDQPGTGESLVLDGTPTSRGGADFDFSVPAGTTFDSANGKLRFKVLSVSGSEAQVAITTDGSVPAASPQVSVPSAPTAVTGASSGNGSATVSWTLPGSGGGTPAQQVVTPHLNGVAQPQLAVTVNGTATSATVGGLTDGSSYTFTVRAANGAGTGAESTPSPAVLVAAVPGTPTGLTVTTVGNSAQLSWSAPASDGGSPVLDYSVVARKNGVAQPATTGTGTSRSVTLDAGVPYTFTVAARNAKGTGAATAPSAAVTYTPVVVIPPVVNPPVVNPPVVSPPVVTTPPTVPVVANPVPVTNPVATPPVTTPPVTPPATTPPTAPRTPGNPVRNQDGSTSYTSPSGSRVVVAGDIQKAYDAAGAGSGSVGLPVQAALAIKDGGSVQRFEKGLIYSKPGAGAHVVSGAVEKLFAGKGWENSSLGYPTSGEVRIKDGGVVQRFEGGLVYSTPATGTHEVSGAFGVNYAAAGWENSKLGYPTSGEIRVRDGGVVQRFQGGLLYWTPATGAHQVSGSFQVVFAAQGWERSALGYPTSEEVPVAGGVRQEFQGGSLVWDRATGKVTQLRR